MAKRKRGLDRQADDGSLVVEDRRAGAGLLDLRAAKVRRANSLALEGQFSSARGGILLPRRSAVQRPDEEDSASEIEADSQESDKRKVFPELCRELSHIKPGDIAFPRSAYEGYSPPLPVKTEAKALKEFQVILERRRRAQQQEPSEHDFVTLDAFSVYRDSRDVRRSGELAGLEKSEVDRRAIGGLVFDGILRADGTAHYVQGVHFKTLTVDGYGDTDITDLSGKICIQSKMAQSFGVWYQLAEPSVEYARFHKPFLWLAEFTKHFVDYLLDMPPKTVTLDDFRFCFHGWLCKRYQDDEHFLQWLAACNLKDFRTTIVAHIPYLWKESSGVEIALLNHPLWGEAHPYNLSAIPMQPNKEQNTVVTPFAYRLFKKMYFHQQLKACSITDVETLQIIRRTKAKLGLAPFTQRPGDGEGTNTALLTPQSRRSTPGVFHVDTIIKGNVVCLDADTSGEWKSGSVTWYAYVQAVHHSASSTKLDVLWLYEAHDTTLGAAFYPFTNELFLSDNCSCGKEAVDAAEVKGKVDISWFAKDPTVQAGFFVRQKFRTAPGEETDDFVSLRKTDFRCRCSPAVKLTDFVDCRRKYDIGDTVLVKRYRKEGTMLQPAVILDFDLDAQHVELRHLQGRSELSNELTITEETYVKPANHIVRACHLRTFQRDALASGLPTGYDRLGAGDFYYIVEDASKPTKQPLMTNGLDLMAPPSFERLVGLGMFCGGGNFDRGLEDGGAVDFRYAVDWADKAMYTYRANAREPDKVHCFLGSVNDYLARAIKGSGMRTIARPGTVDLISAGSPCPGFSSLQQDKQSDGSMRNASMVASVISYVDFYSPKYLLLENVMSMTASLKGDKTQNVFAQILAALVAMGYQVQQFLMDACSFGSSQSRSRVFIIASAPGLEPLEIPHISHDHPATSKLNLQALGKASNGRKFSVRRDHYTPFRCTYAPDAVEDLPNVGDGQSRVCPPFPEHQVPSEESADSRQRIASVPFRPYGTSLFDAVARGFAVGKAREWLKRRSVLKANKTSRAYSRVRPDGLFPAVTTAQRLACGITGRTLHWEQDRPLTVLELKRAMGFLDEEPIIGSPRQQLQIIGNSVDRKVSFALGLSLRQSWSESYASQHRSSGDECVEETKETRKRKLFSKMKDMRRAGASAIASLPSPASEVL